MSNFVNLKGVVVAVNEIECVYPKRLNKMFGDEFVIVVRTKSECEIPIDVVENFDDIEPLMKNIYTVLGYKN